MKNLKREIALISEELDGIRSSELSDQEKLLRLSRLFSYVFEILSENGSLGFTSLFARMTYVINKLNIQGPLSYNLHSFRKALENEEKDEKILNALCVQGENVLSHLIHATGSGFQNPVADLEMPEKLAGARPTFKRIVKGLILQVHPEQPEIIFISDDEAHLRKIAFLKEGLLRKQLISAGRLTGFPLPVSFVDVEIDEKGIYYPGSCVIFPDFLVGVTSISECFQQGESFALSYLVNKLVPSDSNIYMVVGNIVNHFFDELVHSPALDFKKIVAYSFKLAPEFFATMDDVELRTCLDKLRAHFINLREVVNYELKEIGVHRDKVYLEPSFYSAEYGLYGRLDMYHYNPENRQSDIVELKSGKLFRPNSYGLNQNHYLQTLLYDLIIESVYAGKVKTNNFILYSGLESKRLKFAPKLRPLQYEALLIRNDIVIIEHLLSRINEERFAYILDRIDPDKIPKAFNFVQKDAGKFRNLYDGLDNLEKQYFREFLSFLSREYVLSKTGRHGLDRACGMASLWLQTTQEKIDQFSILSGLSISECRAGDEIPVMKLGYSDRSNRVSKFRKGDIVVMYPEIEGGKSALQHQIFKCAIISIDSQSVELRLRARQKNEEVFGKFAFWSIEADSLDSGFNQQFHGLYDFINSGKSYRDLIYGLREPERNVGKKEYSGQGLTEEQNDIVKNAINARDYYLIWGPPGTGKTSIIIKKLAEYYSLKTEMNILLIAYTNRAVDEICDAISTFSLGKFIRIGSRYSTTEAYKGHLLSHITEGLSSRKQLIKKLKETKLFVSTVSSFYGKRDILKLKSFDLVIVDEASQLLEPMLIGLLGRFKKFILIGDHKQLPAVVSQEEGESEIKNDELSLATGLTNCRISLFERMYRNCVKNGWSHAFGALSYQGRMHEDIMNYVNAVFYDGRLKNLPFIKRLSAEFEAGALTGIQEVLCKHRMVFINIHSESKRKGKVSTSEAEIVLKIVRIWKEIYRNNNMDFNEGSIGIISPFRAQIAHIRALQEESELFGDELKDITVDTIERYQGGARNQIIISLAVNRSELMDSISNVSEEGIDRKLNVALTRAREHIIITGNREILSTKEIYRDLIENCYLLDISEII